MPGLVTEGMGDMTGHAYGPTGAGTVLLDLGSETGALVLYTPVDLVGREIEISPQPARRRRPRTWCRGSPAARARWRVCAGLAAGEYTIWQDHDTPAAAVTVTGGQVTCHDWV